MARRRTGGWELVGFDADPTPGDTEAIRAVSSAYGGIAEQAERAYLLLRGARIRDGAGDAMRELNARVGELPDKLRRTSESFHRVAVAYDRYAGTLETAQDRLDQAIDQAEAVHATASLDLPDRPAAGASAAEVSAFERRSGQIEAAREQLGAAERLAAEARSLREDGSGADWGSRQVERELDAAAADAIPERDLWDRAVDLFDDMGEAIDEFFAEFPWIETVLQVAVGILAIAFPVLGLVLGAVLLLVQAWRMAATGNWDITALAIGVLALAGGGIIRGLALAGRLGPVATMVRAASARTGTMQAAVTRATTVLRSAGRTVGNRVRAAVRPVAGRRTDAVVRAGREGLTEGAPASDLGEYAIPFGGHSPDANALVDLGPGSSGINARPTYQDPPFTGTGFTASQEHVVPEFTRNPRAQIPDGARIYQTDRTGKDQLVATYDSELGWTRTEGQR